MNLPSLPRAPISPSILNSGTPVALYGAGGVAREVCAFLTKRGLGVKYFLDHKEIPGSLIEGIPVFKPDSPTLSKEERNSTPVIVAIFNPYVNVPALHEMLARNGWNNVTPFLDFHNTFSHDLEDRFWLTGLNFYSDKDSFYNQAAGIWADARSAQLYENILRYRFTGDYGVLPLPTSEVQYFPDDAPSWASPLRIVDCGAFDGDTIRQLKKSGKAVEAVAAFEPDPANLMVLSREARDAQASVPSGIGVWPCGVWSHTCQLRFSAGLGSGSAVSTSGQTVIQCVSIDDALIGFRPNLIKMDIEGAEYAALLGARETINRYRPGLAICLYHTPAHLWQIPLLISKWQLRYKLYLRLYAHSGFELVMYAIPG